MNEKNKSQNDMLLILGKHMSGMWKIKGIKQLDKPPILKGMIKKNIMQIACKVTKYKQIIPEFIKAKGHIKESLITKEQKKAQKPTIILKKKYKLAISI